MSDSPPAPSGAIAPQEKYWVLGIRVDFLVAGEQCGGAYSLVELTVPPPPAPGSGGPPPHRHGREDEVFHVIQGRAGFMVEGQRFTLGPGQSVRIPRGTLHAFFNEGPEPCRMLNLHAPGGFERFFREAGGPVNGDEVPMSITPEQIQRALAVAAEVHMEVPPPPSA